MGRSFSAPRPESIPNIEKPYYHRPSDRYYSVYARDGRYFQRRHQIGLGGEQTNVEEREIHFVLGSGNHSRSYLHRSPNGRLTQLPLAWYSEGAGFWAMSPGYDRPDHDDFRRRVTYECVFCHNAYPELPAGADASGTAPWFRVEMPKAIDCQRCHGPGRLHATIAARGEVKREAVRAAIVNPARLARDRQLEICMQCHLETTSFRLPYSIRRFERGVFSFRPGEPLGQYALHFDHAAGSGHEDKFEIVNAVYRLRKSACFRKSGMTCTTCHNPHEAVRGSEATRHYARICQGCHAQAAQHQAEVKSGDCVSCHMPKRRTDDVVHVIMTDHYIRRDKPARNLLAPLSEREERYKEEVVPYYPVDPPETYLAVAQVKQGSNLNQGIPRLEQAIQKEKPREVEFYFELAQAYWNDGQRDKALNMYEIALQHKSDFWPALHEYGSTLSKAGQPQRAIEILQRALAVEPGDAASFGDLGVAYLQLRRSADAISVLRRAVEIDPDLTEAWNNLGGALAESGDRTGAEAAYHGAIRVQPDFAPAHANLAGLLVGAGDLPGAQYHFQKAVQSNPKYAEGWSGLGDLQAMKGNLTSAIAYYRKCLELRPDWAEANLNLGSALMAAGQRTQAKPFLQRALESTDARIHDAAAEMLAKQ